VNERQPVQGSANQKPGWIQQLKVYVTRDVLAKLKNKQYMLITFLEAPVLAVILAWFLNSCLVSKIFSCRRQLYFL